MNSRPAESLGRVVCRHGMDCWIVGLPKVRKRSIVSQVELGWGPDYLFITRCGVNYKEDNDFSHESQGR